MNIKEIAKSQADREFNKEDMTNADYYAYEYFIRGIIMGYELATIDGVVPLPFGEGNKVEKY